MDTAADNEKAATTADTKWAWYIQDSPNTKKVAISFYMRWQKRSSGWAYTSSFDVRYCVGARTHNIIDYMVYCKVCATCLSGQMKGGAIHCPQCGANGTVSSKKGIGCSSWDGHVTYFLAFHFDCISSVRRWQHKVIIYERLGEWREATIGRTNLFLTSCAIRHNGKKYLGTIYTNS